MTQIVTPAPTSPFLLARSESPRPSLADEWQEVAARSQLWELIVENSNDPVIVTTAELSQPGPHIVYVNAAFTQLTGYSADEVMGLTPRVLQGPLTDLGEMQRMRDNLEAGLPFVGETINYTKDGQSYFMEWSVYSLQDHDKTSFHYYVAVQRDVSARKRYEMQIEEQTRLLAAANAQLAQMNQNLAELSLTDSLTGISNHRALYQKLEEEVARSARYETPLSLLIIDVDRFKFYNDTFGHPAGDEALQKIALLLQGHGRSNDVVARHGGEEFAVLLPQTDQSGALTLAEEVRATVEKTSWSLHPITVSIGVATLEATPAENPQANVNSKVADLVSQADQALYASKMRGRNCVNCV